ncbi:2-oxoglutarate dehydrogenase, E2 subunit, dihydrolipoamide succinyltransferase [Maricaulis maris MCS10]|uniref:Dihydrolipoyllysine-residue succinyltransferase component of 2-oxoglutarate dehydrogenase complex n=1 Tax=Maricaulis maris (strain MCS10) TaxID=394221 RepID=Q0AKU6_MARMM|nr:2-oxoglutarate dehydrogenase complex dihydrolipoyllysine-residue succinyltransferase [Maricaulis maris]ABI67097.1 2-oxoglutarate dehydrogenase, E2 subunit, dihydrolipoamide succinyltransferase [Maricaulis maris MCS10]
MTDITVPQLGESVTEATVGSWMVKTGDAVSRDDVLVELETDKVAVEVRAEADGVMGEIFAAEGDNVEIGAKLAVIEAAGSDAAAKSEPAEDSSDPAPMAAAEPDVKESKAAGSAETVEATVPQMGESVTEGTIGAWLVKAGDSVEIDQALVEIETDKVAVEVPSPVAGVVSELLVAEGDTVAPGDAVARIGEGGAAQAAPSAESQPSEGSTDTKTMPSAARVIEENRLDAGAITGSGKDGRITKGDALKAAAGAPAAPKAAPAAAAAPVAPRETGPREERVRMTRLRQTIAKRLKDAQNAAAILTTYNEADMSAIMAARKAHQEAFVAKHGVKLGFMSFFVKACCHALKEVPAVNAEIDGTDIIYKNYYDMGVAVGTDRGLVVPVVRDADQMTLAEIEKEIIRLGKRARDGKLSIDEMQGATFTISNGGVYGSLMSMPILNAPQSGILGMHKIQERPMAENGQVVIKPMMYLALSYDHRIVDGKEAVTYLVRVKENLEDPQRMMFDL